MSNSFIIAGCRTPIGRFLGGLSAIVRARTRRDGDSRSDPSASVSPEAIDEVIMGCVLTAGVGQAPARQAALKAGLPPTVAALTINKVCGSGLKAVMLADQAIRAGDARG